MGNRNTEQYFGTIPKIHSARSKFDLSHSVKTTFNNGDIIPLDWMEILPGDTVEINLSQVVRMSTPIYPVMDNLIEDVYFFFVPNRLIWEHWKAFWGENDNPWIQNQEYAVPQIKAPTTTGWAGGTVADYMGLPTGIPNIETSALPFRAYIKIFNDWFRSEAVDYCADLPVNDTTLTGLNEPAQGQTWVAAQKYGIIPLKANKTFDYFTACLPSPQKGPAVGLPLGISANVYTGASHGAKNPLDKTNHVLEWERWNIETGTATAFDYTNSYIPNLMTPTLQSGNKANTFPKGDTADRELNTHIAPSNLVVDLSNATAATVNELRTAFAIQKYYERSAMGSRYIEWLSSIFGVESSDARMQRSEYLGGDRFNVNMSQIIQTSETGETSPQGHASGFSCSIENSHMFTKSFEEHGILMCLMVTRIAEHTYQQGIEKKWRRKTWEQYYNPYFAHLGNQAVLNEEIYAQGRDNDHKNPATGKYLDEEVFGYNEAWADYRFIPNRVTGAMRSNWSNGSLDPWHYADDYDSMPFLSSTWLKEGNAEVDRTLAVTGALAHNFIGDFYFDVKATRIMPVYSIPGLIDHV